MVRLVMFGLWIIIRSRNICHNISNMRNNWLINLFIPDLSSTDVDPSWVGWLSYLIYMKEEKASGRFKTSFLSVVFQGTGSRPGMPLSVVVCRLSILHKLEHFHLSKPYEVLWCGVSVNMSFVRICTRKSAEASVPLWKPPLRCRSRAEGES